MSNLNRLFGSVYCSNLFYFILLIHYTISFHQFFVHFLANLSKHFFTVHLCTLHFKQDRLLMVLFIEGDYQFWGGGHFCTYVLFLGVVSINFYFIRKVSIFFSCLYYLTLNKAISKKKLFVKVGKRKIK